MAGESAGLPQWSPRACAFPACLCVLVLGLALMAWDVHVFHLFHSSRRPVFQMDKKECSFQQISRLREENIDQPKETSPEPIYIPPDLIGNVSDYTFLQDKTLSFVGDSTIHAQYYTMCFTLKGNFTRVEEFRSISSGSSSAGESRFEGECFVPSLNASLLYRGMGRVHKWGSLSPPHVILRDALQELGSSDVLVFNIGVHYHHYCKAHTQKELQEADISFFNSTLLSLVRVLIEDFHVCSQPPCALNTPGSSRAVPLVVWRESLPQHFNSSNGEWANKADPLHRKHDTSSCVPLTVDRQLGAGLPGACVPNCLPANWRNAVSTPVIEQTCLVRLELYADLVSHSELHPPLDCTHYSREANEYMNLKLMDLLKRKVKMC